ncbi:MAG TPA: glycosyltransferase [Candidatus Woesebacteria bacterium]|nr:glycosyltransferase [Candidatus Woesebacteria bacterium]
MGKKFNILFITDIYPPYVKGGAEVSTSLLVNSLVNKKNTCFILTTRILENQVKNTHNIFYFTKLLIPFLDEENKKFFLYRKFNNMTYHVRNFFLLFQILKKHNIDIIHAIPLSYATLPTVIAALLSKKPVVLDVRGYLLMPQYIKKFILQKSDTKYINISTLGRVYEYYASTIFIFVVKLLTHLKKKIFIVALSEYIKKALIITNFQKNKISVIYNISPTIKDKKFIREKGVVFAGILEDTKGIWDCIKAFELLDDKSIILHILGSGSNELKIKHYIKKHKIQNIILHGKIKYTEVWKYYLKNMVILAPSQWPEPFGRFIQEASATGTPLITTKVGGITEFIINYKTGILVDPHHPEQIVKAIKELFNDKILYNEISNNIRLMNNYFSEKTIIRKREATYANLLKKN